MTLPRSVRRGKRPEVFLPYFFFVTFAGAPHRRQSYDLLEVVPAAYDSCTLQEKRYRSMQEHIRRAHPEHYIQKLPATEESFLLMINTDPSTRLPQQPPQPNPTSAPSGAFPPIQGFGVPPVVDRLQGFHHDRQTYDSSNPATPRHADDYTTTALLPAASAAAALAQLHGHRVEQDWETEHVSSFFHLST